MPKKKRFGVSQALTRGLSETIHVVENNSGIFRNVILPLSRIELDPENPRKLTISLDDLRHGFDKNDIHFALKQAELEKLKELANTIETSGLINPIVVYKRGDVYRIVAGERRCLASILAGKQEIEARAFNEKPKAFELKLLQWVENTAREDLTLNERIGNIRDILQEYQNQHNNTPVNATLIKNIMGLSLPQATYYMAVLNAPNDVKESIANGQIHSLDKAAIISGIESDLIRQEALSACLNGSSIKEIRKIIAQDKQKLKNNLSKKMTGKRGKMATRVNMGFTKKTKVIQTIVKSVLNQDEFQKYTDIFSKVDWEHIEHATRAFKKLIDILEQEIKR